MTGRKVMCLLVLFVVALSVSTSTKDNFDTTSLTIKDLQVDLACPMEDLTWHMGRNKLDSVNPTYPISVYGDKDNGLYYCNTTDDNREESYYFYTKIKVCNNCVELNMPVAAAILVGDILFTLGVILVVFLLAKKKTPPATPQRPAHARQTSAPAQDSNYQRLNPATRSKDIYAETTRKL